MIACANRHASSPSLTPASATPPSPRPPFNCYVKRIPPSKYGDTPLTGGGVHPRVNPRGGERVPTPPVNGVSLSRREYLDRYRAISGAVRVILPPGKSEAWRSVLLGLIRLAAYYHTVFPSIRHFALRAGASESTVHRVIRWLESQGYLTVTYVDRTDGSQASNDYDPTRLITAVLRLLAEAVLTRRGLTRLAAIWRGLTESYEQAWTRAGWRPTAIMRGGGAAW